MPTVKLQLRRDLSENWLSRRVILADGEIGLETDTYQFKIGDGETEWKHLPYAGLHGYQGPQGVRGITTTGDTGATGPSGVKGATGPAGTHGLGEGFMVSTTGTRLTYSYDGIIWVDSGSNIFTNNNCNAIGWNGVIWLAVGTIIAYSSNGIQWYVS